MNHHHEFNPTPGKTERIAPALRRIVAPNPSPMTFCGTNTYLLGDTDIAVIDPGPGKSSHLSAILESLTDKQRITHILVTHAHLDHSQLAPILAKETGAPIYAFGPAEAGRSRVMNELAASGFSSGGEGLDRNFQPDVHLQDEEEIHGSGWRLKALHTPGHLGNHLCLACGDACFSGDHVMGWSTSVVSPPDGDLTDFMSSARRLAQSPWRIFYPGHGAPVERPVERLAWLIEHRLERESAILDLLSRGDASVSELAGGIYTDTPPKLLAAASRNVLAHLIDLHHRGLVAFDGDLSSDAMFRRVSTN